MIFLFLPWRKQKCWNRVAKETNSQTQSYFREPLMVYDLLFLSVLTCTLLPITYFSLHLPHSAESLF